MSPEDLELFRNKTAELLSSENPASKLFGSILNDAIDHIDSRAAQIEALKDKLAEERAKILMAGEDEVAEAWEYLKDNPSFINDAYQQLKADPDLQKAGVVWDE